MGRNPYILQLIRERKTLFFVALLAGIVGSLANVLLSLSIGSFYQLFFNSTGNKSRILTLMGFHGATTLQQFFLLFILLVLAKGIFDWVFHYFSKLAALQLIQQIRDRLYAHQLKTGYEYFSAKAPARYLLRYSGDMTAIQQLYTKGLLALIRDLALLGIGFYFLYRLNPGLSLLFYSVVPVLLIVNSILNIPFQRLSKESRDKKSGLLAFVSQSFHAILTIKAFRREGTESKRFHKKSTELFDSSRKASFVQAFLQSTGSFLLFTILGLILFVVARRGVSISEGDLTAFVLLGFLQFSALRRMVKVETIWRSGTISMKKVEQLLRLPVETITEKAPPLSFETLSWSSPDLTTSMELPPVSTVSVKKGVVQFIHCKDTEAFIRSLIGLKGKYEREIKLNDQPLHSYSPEQLRSVFSYSSDMLPLHGRTLYEMVVRSRKPGREEAVLMVLKGIGFEFSQPSLTLRSSLERNKILLSYQERKLLSLARALLSEGSVLVLDKPFDGLGEELVEKCFAFIKSFTPEKTVVILGTSTLPILTFHSRSDLSIVTYNN